MRSAGMPTAGVCVHLLSSSWWDRVRMWMGTLKWPGIRYEMKAASCDNYTGVISSLTPSLQKHGTGEHFPGLLIPPLY